MDLMETIPFLIAGAAFFITLFVYNMTKSKSE